MTERALTARINRALAAEREAVVKSRSAVERQEFGDHYIINLHTGNPVCLHCDLDALAYECGVLAAIPGGDPSLTMKKGE